MFFLSGKGCSEFPKRMLISIGILTSFRKVTKKGAFPNENALLKLLYLCVTELYKKWNGRPLNNWALVRNQLDMDEKIQERIRKYEHGGF